MAIETQNPETIVPHAGYRADPATTTYSQLSPDERLATGVSDGYVRLSVGIEPIEDILGDLDQALKAAAA